MSLTLNGTRLAVGNCERCGAREMLFEHEDCRGWVLMDLCAGCLRAAEAGR